MAAPTALARRAVPSRPTTLLRLSIVIVVGVLVGRVHDLVPFLSTLPVAKVMLPLAWLAVLSAPGARARLAALATTQARMFYLLLAAMAISLPFSLYRSVTLSFLILIVTSWVPFVLLIAVACADERLLYDVGRAVAVSELILGVAILAGKARMVEGRIMLGAMYDPNDLALFGVVAFPFTVWMMGDRSALWRWTGVASAAGALATIVMSASRGGMLGLGAVVILIGVRYGSRVPLKWKIVAALLVVASLKFAPSTFWERLQTLKDPNADYNASAETGRLAIWKRGIGYFLHRPLTGVGLAAFPTAEGLWAMESRSSMGGFRWSVAHSVWISVLAELGILGIVGYLGMFLPTLRDVRRLHAVPSSRAPPQKELVGFGDALFISIVGFFVAGTFLAMQYSPPAMMLMGVGMAYALLSARARAMPGPNGRMGPARPGLVADGPAPRPAISPGVGLPQPPHRR